jgi:hypothetical protein
MKNLMRKFLKAAFWYLMFDGLILGYMGLIPGVQSAAAQTILSTTTLASAVTSSATTSFQLTSSTGVTAGATVLFIADTGNTGEAVFVNSVSSSGGYVSVTRGYQTLGAAAAHASGALVFIGSPSQFKTVQPRGSCTRSTASVLPVIAFGLAGTASTISDCIGGNWVTSSGDVSTYFRVNLPPLGSVAWSSVGTSTAIAAATSMYCTEIDVPYSKYVTGLGVLNGATAGGTDKHLVILYDGTGKQVANSAVAGVSTSGPNVFQTFAFTSPYYVVGPARYYACLQSNGTTDTVRMLATGTMDNTTTKAVTGQTFGTIAASFTVPTTFTTVVGPVWELY